jgi:hypothetical protein
MNFDNAYFDDPNDFTSKEIPATVEAKDKIFEFNITNEEEMIILKNRSL